MSLAGAQEKLGLRIDAHGAMFLPEGSAPSTHIVKPENASADFPHCPANEFFCMRLAHELKVPVPAVGLLHLPEPLYVIERFDRAPLDKSPETAAGRAFGRLHQIDLCQALGVAVIDAVSQRYGVPSELIVAIVGIETNYGSNMGSFRLGDSLTTLAFSYPRRAEFFQKELDQFLQLAHEEKQDMFTFKGSYAGAMGMPQFMPSSYRQWAVDWDGDGHRDIWNNVGDVAASVANYMKQHGWQTGAPMAVPVQLNITPELQALLDAKTELNHTVGDFRRLGVQVPGHVADREKALLYQLEIAPGQYQYWLGLNNFYTVWQYNHSRMYVSAVREIANGLRGGNGGL